MNMYLDYDVQQEFELSRDMLRYYVDLRLSITEQIILRGIVSDAIDELPKIQLARNRYRPATESAVRFLFQEYGISQLDIELYEPIIGGYYDPHASFVLNFLQNQRNLL
ncbi:hypothetical protein HYX12_01900 [Candidatus Woesearchaeota archaeon]|nr:hypothetical protein [Candidatus Woesearchaeota archaeon]